MAATLKHGEHPLAPFHWGIEFPEVFSRENGGFDAIVGNPPFAGKNMIAASNRPEYGSWLQAVHSNSHGNADQVAHFFRRAFKLARQQGVFGLIATNTIGQGDTRSTGLAVIITQGGAIYRATRRIKWPGEAAVTISVVHVVKGQLIPVMLDGHQVRRVSAYLVDGDLDTSPAVLDANAGKSFIGSYVLGMGFTFDNDSALKGAATSLAEMKRLVELNPRNAGRIFAYIGGDEINSDPRSSFHRYVIDFADLPLRRESMDVPWSLMTPERKGACLRVGLVPLDFPDPVAADWPDLLEIVTRLVKPEREIGKRKARRERWWRFGDRQPGLYRAKEGLSSVFALSRVSEHLAVAQLSTAMVYSERCVVFPFESLSAFCAIQCRVHEIWARFFSATMEDRLLYAPSDCFHTYPFSNQFEGDPNLESAGRASHDHRAALMIARNEGMTKTYNRFHNRNESSDDIKGLRELHAAMDRAVLEAYGWHDLAERAEPVFLDETNEDGHTYQGRLFWPSGFRDEVLARLLALNAERHAEEVRLGIAPGVKGKKQDNDEEYEEE
jgi:hypothetical protein